VLAKQNEDQKTSSRCQMLAELKNKEFDLLIIGGGATGAGALLDAASRNLKVALVEAGDFSSGSSSRSTKLVHGGVRYLEKAVKTCNLKEYQLVRDALYERKIFLKNARHLTNSLAILTPVYNWFEAFYYLMGLKLYDFVARGSSLGPSEFISRERALSLFPHLKKAKLKGAVVYHDGQFNDARMNLSLVLSAVREGALALNYVRVESLVKENGKLVGAMVKNLLDRESFLIRARAIINASGPFADCIRQMADDKLTPIMVHSQGSHVILPKRFAPSDKGMIIPHTKDERVLFLLPWQGKALAGTTDKAAILSKNPSATNDEVEFILEHLRIYLDVPLKREDVLATFSGLRPLVKTDKKDHFTKSISRDHFIEVLPSGLVSIVGGKWTTYRKMAEDVVSVAIKSAHLENKNPSRTKDLALLGSDGKAMAFETQLDDDVVHNLLHNYGSESHVVLSCLAGDPKRLLEGYPYLEAEVIYAVRHEYAVHAADILGRRLRLAFLDNNAARLALPRVIELMKAELNWSNERVQEEKALAEDFLKSMFTLDVEPLP
jgi:glycerol-3-phosphate dehydrogenase